MVNALMDVVVSYQRSDIYLRGGPLLILFINISGTEKGEATLTELYNLLYIYFNHAYRLQ